MCTIIFHSIIDLGMGTLCNYHCSCTEYCQYGQGTTYIPKTHYFHSFFPPGTIILGILWVMTKNSELLTL